MSDMGQQEVEARIAGLSPDMAKSVVCALVGHSRIVTTCFGYIYCARCGAQIGDSLAAADKTDKNVIVGHACDTCRSNFAECNWRDTFMTPDPFDAEEIKRMREARGALVELRQRRGAERVPKIICYDLLTCTTKRRMF